MKPTTVISDNLGVRPIMDKVFFLGGVWNALQASGGDDLRRLVVMVVNAQRSPDIKVNASVPARSGRYC